MAAVDPVAFERLRRLSDEGLAVFARDASERIVFWSGGCQQLLGLPAARALGRHCHDIVGGRDAYGNVHCLHNCRIAHLAREGAESVRVFPLLVPAKGGWKRFDVETFSIPSFHPSLSTLVHVLREGKDGNGRKERPREEPADPLRPIEAAESRLAVLTSREREVLGLLARSTTTPRIAAELRISEATVRNHIAAILQRLGVHSKLAAVALTYRNHLL